MMAVPCAPFIFLNPTTHDSLTQHASIIIATSYSLTGGKAWGRTVDGVWISFLDEDILEEKQCFLMHRPVGFAPIDANWS